MQNQQRDHRVFPINTEESTHVNGNNCDDGSNANDIGSNEINGTVDDDDDDMDIGLGPIIVCGQWATVQQAAIDKDCTKICEQLLEFVETNLESNRVCKRDGHDAGKIQCPVTVLAKLGKKEASQLMAEVKEAHEDGVNNSIVSLVKDLIATVKTTKADEKFVYNTANMMAIVNVLFNFAHSSGAQFVACS